MKVKLLMSLMIIFTLLAVGGNSSSEFNSVLIINKINPAKDIISANNVGEETTQHQATIGEPVKWIKNIRLNKSSETILLELPEEAKNISVNKIMKGKRKKIPPEKIKFNKSEDNFPDTLSNFITGGVVGVDQKNENRFFAKFFNWLFGSFMGKDGITGAVIGTVADEDNPTENRTVIENITELEVEYYTKAPAISNEENIDRGKRVVVTSKIHYENVLVFTDIPEGLNIKNPSTIRIKWIENNSFIPIGEIKDRDDNGIYDYIEWIAPHLSNQTFEIIILAAEHLDENREFIEDIYDYVNETDNITYTIPEGEYARAYFERNLTNKNVIDIYVRNIEPAVIEVYEKDSGIVIGKIENVLQGVYYISLNHSGSQSVFDLKSVDNEVVYDYIHDAAPGTFGEDFNTNPCTSSGGDCTVSGTYTVGVNQNIDLDINLDKVDTTSNSFHLEYCTDVGTGNDCVDDGSDPDFAADCTGAEHWAVAAATGTLMSDSAAACSLSGAVVTCSGSVDMSTGTYTLLWEVTPCTEASGTYDMRAVMTKIGSGIGVGTIDHALDWAQETTDTCTAPGSGDWAITCSDNCVWNTDFTVPANISIAGSGTLTWNANMTMTAANWEIYKEDGCNLSINPGGSIR